MCILVFLGALLSRLHLLQHATKAEVKRCLHMLVNTSLLLQASLCMAEHQQEAICVGGFGFFFALFCFGKGREGGEAGVGGGATVIFDLNTISVNTGPPGEYQSRDIGTEMLQFHACIGQAASC